MPGFETWLVLASIGFGFNGALAIAFGVNGYLILAVILAAVSGIFLIALSWQLREHRFLEEWMLSFEARREAIESELQLIELEAGEGHSASVLMGHLDFCLDQVLCLAAAITDRPTDALSANYMAFDSATRRLRITQIFGTYSRLRVAVGARLGRSGQARDVWYGVAREAEPAPAAGRRVSGLATHLTR